MLSVIFTLDYEIHGNGEGCPYELMVEPTDRMLAQFDRYGAKLTIMADIGEILQFKQYKAQFGRDDYHYDQIAEQLQRAVRTGHDVQLHIHSSYFNARYSDGRWIQHWPEYNFAGLPLERMDYMVRTGKQFLEELLQPVKSGYRCTAFRAANWSVSPSSNVVRALVNNGLQIDTSVFKYGRREGIVNFDYSHAADELGLWRASSEDLCLRDDAGPILEAPIYSEQRWIGAFVTLNRIYRAASGAMHKIQDMPQNASTAAGNGTKKRSGLSRKLSLLLDRHAWKADFNQCTGRQLIRALGRAGKAVNGTAAVPFVLIGHSKIYSKLNERSLRPFLAEVQKSSPGVRFGTFADFA